MAKDSNGLSILDANQVIRASAVDLAGGGMGGGVVVMNSLVPDEYDQTVMTYVAAGNGVGEIETVVYKLSGATVATLTMTYDGSDRLIDVIRS